MTQTRTFPLTLNSTTLDTVTELVHFRDSPLEPGDKAAVYLEACFCNILLKSFQLMKFPSYEGDEDDGERLAKFSAAEMASQKVGLRILSRKNNTGAWREKGEIILTNAGRKSYFDLLIPYLAKAQVRLLEYNDALAVQLIDYGNGLLKLTDFVEIECAVSIEIEKKNDFETLTNRIQALENLLSLFGAATPTTAGTNGLIKGAAIGQQNFLLKGDRTWQDPVTLPVSVAATTAINNAVANLVASAPAALDTLNELATALGNDANFANTITNNLSGKASLINSLQLTPRSNAVNSPFNANNWVLTHFAGIKWLDGNYTNLNVPVNTGMLFQFDSLFNTGATGKYRVQHYYSGIRFFVRAENDAVWQNWREITTVAI